MKSTLEISFTGENIKRNTEDNLRDLCFNKIEIEKDFEADSYPEITITLFNEERKDDCYVDCCIDIETAKILVKTLKSYIKMKNIER